jgi:hypothetical protein
MNDETTYLPVKVRVELGTTEKKDGEAMLTAFVTLTAHRSDGPPGNLVQLPRLALPRPALAVLIQRLQEKLALMEAGQVNVVPSTDTLQ